MNFIIYIFLLLLPELIYAQADSILSLLAENNFKELRRLRNETTGAEKVFLEAIFETNADGAMAKFNNLISNYPENPLVSEAKRRIQEYNFLKENIIDYYWVQTGAFMEFANAERQKRELLKMGLKVKIVKKEGDKTLYLVRVGAFDTEFKAKETAQRIENRLTIKTQLVTEGG